MKPVLIILAVLVCGGLYELERSFNAPRDHGTTTRDAPGPDAARIGIPREPGSLRLKGLEIEQDRSIRLFGPGLSRKQQVHV